MVQELHHLPRSNVGNGLPAEGKVPVEEPLVVFDRPGLVLAGTFGEKVALGIIECPPGGPELAEGLFREENLGLFASFGKRNEGVAADRDAAPIQSQHRDPGAGATLGEAQTKRLERLVPVGYLASVRLFKGADARIR